MTMEKRLPSESKRASGLMEITQISIENTTKQGVLHLIKKNFGDTKPLTLVCCDCGVSRSLNLAQRLAEEDAVDLCIDHYYYEGNEPCEDVQGVAIPSLEFKLNKNNEVRSDLDKRGLALLIICTDNKDAYRGDPHQDKYDRKRKWLIDRLKRAISQTRSDYILRTMIIEGSETQFIKVFLGKEYDENGRLLSSNSWQ
jgi:hypothetical protein